MITDVQVREYSEAIAGDESMLMPVMPPWWITMSDAERDEVMRRAEQLSWQQYQAAIKRYHNDKK